MHFPSIVAVIVLATAATALSGTQAQRALDCYSMCSRDDVDCNNQCAASYQSQAQATIDCVRDTCDQGTGTAADSEAYADCEQQCIADYFMTSQAGVIVEAFETVTLSAGTMAILAPPESTSTTETMTALAKLAISTTATHTATTHTTTTKRSSRSTVSATATAMEAVETGNAGVVDAVGAPFAAIAALLAAALAL